MLIHIHKILDKNRSFKELKFQLLIDGNNAVHSSGCLGSAGSRPHIGSAALDSSLVYFQLLFFQFHHFCFVIMDIRILLQVLQLMVLEFALSFAMGSSLGFFLADREIGILLCVVRALAHLQIRDRRRLPTMIIIEQVISFHKSQLINITGL